jgi:transcriptional regulator with XRE-family HTH domain
MAHPAYLREKARELRRKRKLSLLEIAERLALPKTTVFYWIRDLPIPEFKYGDTPARARARAKAARRNVAKFKALRDAAYERGWEEYPEPFPDADIS